MRGSSSKSLLFGSLFACGALAIFVLPFYVNTGSTPVFSTAWACGAENRAAYVALAAVSAVAVFFCWFLPTQTVSAFRVESPVPPPERIDRAFGFHWYWLVALSLFIACWSLGWGTAIVRSNLRVGETNYFLEQTRNAAGIGLPAPMRIYKDLEFPYGPLLLEAPVWLWHIVGRFGVSVASCYVLTLGVFNVAGFLLLVYILQKLPITPWSRGVFALCSTFVALHPLFGPNYSLFKFLWPVAVLVSAAACGTTARRLLIYIAGSFVMLMTSPELSVGLSAALIAAEIVNARNTRRRSLFSWLNFLAPLIALGLFTTYYGLTFVERLRQANSGALNLVIQPMPDVLIFLVAVTWLAPEVSSRFLSRALARQTNETGQSTALSSQRLPTLIVGLFVLALGMLPGALGRADPLHIFFNGLPFWLLSLVAVKQTSRPIRRTWLVALIVLSLQVQADNFHFYGRSLRDVILAQRRPAVSTLDLARLEAIVQDQPVTAPILYAVSLPDEALLRLHHMLKPTSAPGLAEVWNEASEDRRIQEIRETEWALVPKADFIQVEHAPGSITVSRTHRNDSLAKRLLRKGGQGLFGFPYKEKRAPYAIGTALTRELNKNWKPVQSFGDLWLYHRLR